MERAMSLEVVEQQARMLARDNRQAEPEILDVYWFPDEQEVRLVELTPVIPASGDGRVHPFYFNPNPSDNLPVPSGIALIRPEEFRILKTPSDWGDWDHAVRITPEEQR